LWHKGNGDDAIWCYRMARYVMDWLMSLFWAAHQFKQNHVLPKGSQSYVARGQLAHF
jgi:hypothetical protein